MMLWRLAIGLIAIAATVVLTAWQIRIIRGDEPTDPVLRVPCKVIEVVDGDTVTVEVTLRARVRLEDCWADERVTPEGAKAQRYLQQTALQKDAILQVDLMRFQRLDDAFTFGRILGRLYIDGEDVGASVVRAGHAKARKEK